MRGRVEGVYRIQAAIGAKKVNPDDRFTAGQIAAISNVVDIERVLREFHLMECVEKVYPNKTVRVHPGSKPAQFIRKTHPGEHICSDCHHMLNGNTGCLLADPRIALTVLAQSSS